MARRRRRAPSRFQRLVELYGGAAITQNQARAQGETAGGLAAGHRRALLLNALAAGRVGEDRLSDTDRALVRGQTRRSGLGDSPGGITAFGLNIPGSRQAVGFLGNLFGERGLYGAATGFLPGVWETGKAIFEDISENPELLALGPAAPLGAAVDEDSRTRQKVVNPLVEQYKWQYGPLFSGDIAETGRRFYQNPLGPILDVATLASGGSAAAGRVGGTLARAGAQGPVSRALVRATSPYGREPIPLNRGLLPEAAQRAMEGQGLEAATLPRFYSTSPIRRARQKYITDPLLTGGFGNIRPLGQRRRSIAEFSQRRAINRYTDELQALQRSQIERNVDLESEGLRQALRKLTPTESTALSLVQRGVNTPERLARMTDYWEKSLRGQNPEGQNIQDFPETSREHLEYLAGLRNDPEMLELLSNPTENMVNAARAWEAAQVRGRERLGVDPEVEAGHLAARERIVSGRDQEPPTEPPLPPPPGGGGPEGPGGPPSFPPSPLLSQAVDMPEFQIPEIGAASGERINPDDIPMRNIAEVRKGATGETRLEWNDPAWEDGPTLEETINEQFGPGEPGIHLYPSKSEDGDHFNFILRDDRGEIVGWSHVGIGRDQSDPLDITLSFGPEASGRQIIEFKNVVQAFLDREVTESPRDLSPDSTAVEAAAEALTQVFGDELRDLGWGDEAAEMVEIVTRELMPDKAEDYDFQSGAFPFIEDEIIGRGIEFGEGASMGPDPEETFTKDPREIANSVYQGLLAYRSFNEAYLQGEYPELPLPPLKVDDPSRSLWELRVRGRPDEELQALITYWIESAIAQEEFGVENFYGFGDQSDLSDEIHDRAVEETEAYWPRIQAAFQDRELTWDFGEIPEIPDTPEAFLAQAASGDFDLTDNEEIDRQLNRGEVIGTPAEQAVQWIEERFGPNAEDLTFTGKAFEDFVDKMIHLFAWADRERSEWWADEEFTLEAREQIIKRIEDAGLNLDVDNPPADLLAQLAMEGILDARRTFDIPESSEDIWSALANQETEPSPERSTDLEEGDQVDVNGEVGYWMGEDPDSPGSGFIRFEDGSVRRVPIEEVNPAGFREPSEGEINQWMESLGEDVERPEVAPDEQGRYDIGEFMARDMEPPDLSRVDPEDREDYFLPGESYSWEEVLADLRDKGFIVDAGPPGLHLIGDKMIPDPQVGQYRDVVFVVRDAAGEPVGVASLSTMSNGEYLGYDERVETAGTSSQNLPPGEIRRQLRDAVGLWARDEYPTLYRYRGVRDPNERGQEDLPDVSGSRNLWEQFAETEEPIPDTPVWERIDQPDWHPTRSELELLHEQGIINEPTPEAWDALGPETQDIYKEEFFRPFYESARRTWESLGSLEDTVRGIGDKLGEDPGQFGNMADEVIRQYRENTPLNSQDWEAFLDDIGVRGQGQLPGEEGMDVIPSQYPNHDIFVMRGRNGEPIAVLQMGHNPHTRDITSIGLAFPDRNVRPQDYFSETTVSDAVRQLSEQAQLHAESLKQLGPQPTPRQLWQIPLRELQEMSWTDDSQFAGMSPEERNAAIREYHRRHVETAFQAGRPVPPEIAQSYGLGFESALPSDVEIPEFQLGDIGSGGRPPGEPPTDFGEPPGFEPELPRPDYPIRPVYVPDISTEGMEFKPPGVPGTFGLARRGDPELLQVGERRAKVNEPDAKSLFVPSVRPYLHTSQLETFRAGVFRTDPRALLSHVAARERDFVETEFNQEALAQVALRTPEGEMATFKSQADVDVAAGTRGKYILVYPDMPTRWYRAETNVLEQVVKRIEQAREEGEGPVMSDALIQELNKMLDDDAQAFVHNYLGAAKTHGVAVPEEFYRRMQQHARVGEDFSWQIANLYVAALNKWRTLTLAYMPRWWVNTAVGSFFLNMMKGVWNPRYYQEALRLRGSADLPPGVRLGGMVAAERTLGPGRSGMQNSIFPTQKLYDWVQNVEDTFRTASYIHSLRKADRQNMNEIGESLKTLFPYGRKDDDYIDELIANPEYRRWAMNQVNKFSYNYMQLGPLERRYVRQFVPFWGWYKFITKLMWNMPLEYPGRTNVMYNLGLIGKEALYDAVGEEEAKNLPPWVRSSILLTGEDPSNIRYLGTSGLNPFANFANPFSPTGTIAGLAGLGQASPLVQAGLMGLGIDPQTGDRVRISPEEPVAEDFLGRLINTETGQPIRSLGEVAGGRRFLATLMRSVPQVRIGETLLTGGNPVYPESIPLIAERPVGIRPENRRPVSVEGILGEYSGIRPRSFDLERQTELNEKSLKYARKRRKSRLKRERGRLEE